MDENSNTLVVPRNGPDRPVSEAVSLASKVLRGLGDKTRLAIVVELSRRPQRVGDLVVSLGCSQANVSGHLRCLRECGLVIDRRSGREVTYQIAHREVTAVMRSVQALLDVCGESVELCPNYVEAVSR